MMGIVPGQPKKIITNVSIAMTPHFREVMNTILVEAREGIFETKLAAVRRRDELIANLKVDTAQVRDVGCLIGRLVVYCYR